MEQPTDTKKTEQVGAVIILVIIAIIALIYFVILPQINSLKENNIQTAAKKLELKDKEQQLNNLKDLQPKIAAAQAEVQKLAIALPKKEKISELIVQLDAMAQKNGLEITIITPSQSPSVSTFVEEAEGLSAGTAKTTAEQSTEPIVSKYNFSITIIGKYAGIFDFLQSVESNLRPLKIQKAEFSGAQGGDPNITGKLVFETYYQK